MSSGARMVYRILIRRRMKCTGERDAKLAAVRDIADEWDSPRLHAILDSGTPTP